MTLSKGQKVGIGIGVAVVVAAIVALVVWLLKRDKATDGGRTDPTPSPTPGDRTDPEPTPQPAGPDPMNPKATPTKGEYYIVRSGDSEVNILQKAGFTSSQMARARRACRDHVRNAWIPKTSDITETSYDERALNLFQGWAPMAGKESLSWAWQTERVTWANRKWPIVYVPTDGEVTL